MNLAVRTLRALAALVVGCGVLLAVTTVGDHHVAGATSVTGSVTYTHTGSTPIPLPSKFQGPSQGDGWSLVFSNTQVFNVFHHQSSLQIDCHQLATAAECWSAPKTVTNGAVNFATSIDPGMVFDSSNGHLYVYAVDTTNSSAGVVCIDTTQPASATGAQLFCGYTQLSATGDAPLNSSSTAGLSAPAQVGNEWYSFNEVGGAGGGGGGGTENRLLCFNLATDSACGGGATYPVAMAGQKLAAFPSSYPLGVTGSDVIVQIVGATSTLLSCFDASTHAACWALPLVVTAVAGSPFPLLNASGTPTGFCLPVTGNPCYSSSTGSLVATPPGMAAAVGANNLVNGRVVTIGSSVYIPNWDTTAVDCYDYATSSECANYPVALSGLALLYTVNPDPLRPQCLWVNSDHGAWQIQNFDATTGGPCQEGPIVLQSSSIVAPGSACIPSQYTSMQILQPVPSAYTSATVEFESSTGAALPGVPTETVGSNGSINLAPLKLSNSTPLPQFVITIEGDTSDVKTVELSLTWRGVYAKSCTAGGQIASGTTGYWIVASDGGIFSYGTAGFYGSTGAITLNKPIVGMADTPDGNGYWLVASDGGIFSYGDASFHGSTGAITLNKPIVGMASTPDGNGYWLVASDGGIFSFGDAAFHGSTGAITLNKPIVGMASTPDGKGYWLVASDGGIFSFGDAAFHGSTGAITLNKPIVGMASTPDGKGYWLVASDGGIFSFGDAKFYGSTGAITLNKPIVGMTNTFDGNGYWLVASDGGIFSFGDAAFHGSAGNITLNKPIVGMAS